MKKFILIIILSFIVFSVYAEEYAMDRIIVKFKDKAEIQRLHSINNTKSMGIIKGNTHVVKVSKGKNVKAMVRKFKKMKDVEYAELDYMVYADLTPNDTYFYLQHGLHQGNDKDIDAPEAWDITTGDSGVVIAILDSGIFKNHEDFIGKVILEVNFTHSPLPDRYQHGSHCAGIVAANTNNSTGIAGVGYDCSLMNVKVLNDGGGGYHSWIIDGIYFAADNGANVISMSFGGGSISRSMEDAIDYAWGKGCVLVASAGNNGHRLKRWPATYDNVISVGAIDIDGTRASFSNYGPWVDVAAPGVHILSVQSISDDSYMYASGTSMSTPFVAGLAGLLFAVGYGSNESIRDRIQDTCDRYGVPIFWGYGVINAYAAVGAGVPITLDSIAVTPANFTIPNTTTQQYTAIGTYSDATTMDITNYVVWASDTPTVATIGVTGLATAVGAGNTTISATFGVVGNTTLTVIAATLSSIVVTPANITLEVNGVQQYTAIGTYSDSSTSDITEEVTWSSSDNVIADIDTNGIATTYFAGSVTISAVLAGKTGSTTLSVTVSSLVSITVIPNTVSIGIGATRQFVAYGRYSNNAYINISNIVVWSSSNISIATVSISGLATGIDIGNCTVRARIGDIEGYGILTILGSSPTLSFVSITPPSAAIPIGATRKFSASATYSDGSTLNVTNDATWSSSVIGVATVNTTGLTTAVSSGTTFISAIYDGVRSNNALLRVITSDVSLADISVLRRHFDLRGIAVTGYKELRAAAQLTNVFVDTMSTEFDQFKSVGILFSIITGSMSTVEYKIFTSYDGLNWFEEAMEIVEPGVIMDKLNFYTVPLYESAEYHTELVENRIFYKVIPFYGHHLKLQVKGIGNVVGSSCSIEVIGVYQTP